MAQSVKNPPTTQETWVQSLLREDAAGKGNGNPLQYSCLGNPMDRGVAKESVTTKQLNNNKIIFIGQTSDMHKDVLQTYLNGNGTLKELEGR